MFAIALSVLAAKLYKNKQTELAAVLEKIGTNLGIVVLIALCAMWLLYFVYSGELAGATATNDMETVAVATERLGLIRTAALVLIIL